MLLVAPRRWWWMRWTTTCWWPPARAASTTCRRSRRPSSWTSLCRSTSQSVRAFPITQTRHVAADQHSSLMQLSWHRNRRTGDLHPATTHLPLCRPPTPTKMWSSCMPGSSALLGSGTPGQSVVGELVVAPVLERKGDYTKLFPEELDVTAAATRAQEQDRLPTPNSPAARSESDPDSWRAHCCRLTLRHNSSPGPVP